MSRHQLMLKIKLFIILMKYGISQECRQVTVCDRDTSRGEKGDVGSPGKAGPLGLKGEKGRDGEVGDKGNIGAACGVEEFQREVRAEFAELKRFLLPTSYEGSVEYGRQTLRSGEEVFCDGKWTVFQKRFNGSVDFDRTWNEYKHGFGGLDGEFWYGLDRIHLLTKQRGCRVRFDIWNFDGDHAFAEYSDFHIEDESDSYRLHIDGYNGTAGNGMTGASVNLNNMQFSTLDRDNDMDSRHCAQLRGGFWHNNCAHVHPNNVWGAALGPRGNILWNIWRNHEPLKETVIKLRCN